jgi:plastocyanin
MSFTRCILAVGLVLAVLSTPTARAQEAEVIEMAEGEVAPVESVEQIEALDVAPADPVAPPTIEVVVAPTAVPTIAPTPVPTAVAAPAVVAGPLTALVVDNRFQQPSLSVGVGTTVTWVNNGTNFHTLSTSERLFDSGPMGGGQTFSYTFQQPGSYLLICRQHILSGMSSRITVQ